MTESLFYSFIIGFFAASPIGPVGLLCMRRAILEGFTSGIISALGISCAYSFWAYVSIHGLAAFSHWIEKEHRPLAIAIGLFFILYGLHGIFNQPNTEYPTLKSRGRVRQFFSTFLVIFLNPATFVMFTAFFTLCGVAKGHFGFLDAIEIALFVFIGAITFWLLASYSIRQMRNKIEHSIFQTISRGSAFGMTAFGIIIFLYAVVNIS